MPIKPVRRLARTLLATTFIAGGVSGLMNPKPRAAAADALAAKGRTGLPDALAAKVPDNPSQWVRINAAVQVAGGLLLASGRAPRPAAFVLAATVVPGTVTEQDFWAEPDPDRRAAKRTGFLKDLGLLGGLLITAADTAGKPSLGWRAREAVAHREPADHTAMLDAAKLHGAQFAEAAQGQGEHLAAIAQERGAQLSEFARERGPQVAGVARERGAQLSELARERGPQVAGVARERGAQLSELAREHAPQLAEAAKERGAQLSGIARERAPQVAEVAKQRGGHWSEIARERAPQLAETARERGAHLAELAKDRGPEFAEAARQRGTHLAEVLRERGAQAAEVARQRAEVGRDHRPSR
ncbi:DoxX family membrane protein [Nocardia sp. NPDC059177]|uniref:DoxX family membrane protein n=1 Tax=Nocardia sp. NPDC059177 TaxID=3346759 RepID=UPI0036A456AB